jgi:hypothetical protein
MLEDGSYVEKEAIGEPGFNIHKEFFHVTEDQIMTAKLF